jgi:hypothetical protein
MSHFYIDDQFPFHPKAVLAGNAAIGLWSRMGAWSKQQATGGIVPADMALATGSRAEVAALLRTKLWHGPGESCGSAQCLASVSPVPVGHYSFHDWKAVSGNGSGEEEKQRRDAARAAQRERTRKHRDRSKEPPSGNTASNAVTGGVTGTVSNADGNGPVTAPPVPVPLTNLPESPHVPERARGRTDDRAADDDVDEVRRRNLTGLGISNIAKVQQTIIQRTGRHVDLAMTHAVVLDLLVKGGDGIKNPQAYVVGAIASSWAEIQQFIDVVVDDSRSAVAS